MSTVEKSDHYTRAAGYVEGYYLGLMTGKGNTKPRDEGVVYVHKAIYRDIVEYKKDSPFT